jgi:hypothetical protein
MALTAQARFPVGAGGRYDIPPEKRGWAGAPRRVGVEFEFIGITAAVGAALVCDLFGGEVRDIDPHHCRVEGSAFGQWDIKLDSRLAHKPEREKAPQDLLDEALDWIDTGARQLFADIAEAVVPLEIVSPPVPITELAVFDVLLDRLRAFGAEGTDEGLLYAFGTHFNPELASLEAPYLQGVTRAYALLEDALRQEIALDPMRRLLPFVDPFPARYVRKVADPDYASDLRGLIADYTADNPTRNRGLDMLTPFAHIDHALVDQLVPASHVGARPTFHYRLPDLRLNDPDWSLAREWNRWVKVERAAQNEALLDQLGVAYLGRDGRSGDSLPDLVRLALD